MATAWFDYWSVTLLSMSQKSITTYFSGENKRKSEQTSDNLNITTKTPKEIDINHSILWLLVLGFCQNCIADDNYSTHH